MPTSTHTRNFQGKRGEGAGRGTVAMGSSQRARTGTVAIGSCQKSWKGE